MSDLTSYIVLRRITAGDTTDWRPIDEITATSSESAIRIAVLGLPERQDGAYVAVPLRSWRPLTVQAVQQTVLKLEQPT